MFILVKKDNNRLESITSIAMDRCIDTEQANTLHSSLYMPYCAK